MIKHFCDFCGRKIEHSGPDYNKYNRLCATAEKNGVKLELDVIQSVNGTSNSGDICRYCILDTLATLDDRPKHSTLTGEELKYRSSIPSIAHGSDWP